MINVDRNIYIYIITLRKLNFQYQLMFILNEKFFLSISLIYLATNISDRANMIYILSIFYH